MRLRFSWLVLLVVTAVVTVSAQESAIDALIAEARTAIGDQRYDEAVRILEEGARLYPQTTRFTMLLGDLYYDRELFDLALSQYLRAESIDAESYQIREAIAYTYGRLGNDRASMEYWQAMVDDFPDRPGPVQNLGWLLFKVHRLDEGVTLVKKGLDTFGPDPDLTMTLATLYADMYRFDDSQSNYRRAIALADAVGDDNFVAVAYYNLSLLQKAFHHFADSLESTTASLAYGRRATGFLARGELYELRLDYERAASDYTTAYNLDDQTPLARMNLATLNQRFGRLDEALAYARSVYEDSDRSWMYNFGTDTDRHAMDTHEMLADCYEALRHVARLTPSAGIVDRARLLWKRVRYRVQEWYHRSRFRRLAGSVAQAYLEQGSEIDGTWTFFQAVEPYRPVARSYLLDAASLETDVVPEASLSYEVEVARLEGDLGRLQSALLQIRDPWDAHLRERALRSIAELLRRRPNDGRYVTVAAQLFQLNPGGLRQYGLLLPVRLNLSAVTDRVVARRIRRTIGRAGFHETTDAGAPLLTLQLGGGEVTALLAAAPPTGREAAATLKGRDRRSVATAVASLADQLLQAR